MKKTPMRKKTMATLLIILMISTLVMAMPIIALAHQVEYSYLETIQVASTSSYLIVNVTEEGEWVTWEFDFPVEDFTGDGNLNVGLIIALDDKDEGPAFQIHNNDGATTVSPHGTWMYGSWGPTIGDGWFGWPSASLGVNVTDLDWVEASGERKGQGTDGILTISIHESKLGSRFHWAASPTVGSGFYAPAYDVTMQVPTAFSWSSPLVDMDVPNYKFAEIVIPPPAPKKHGGPIYYDGINSWEMCYTPHKLINVNLWDGPTDSGYYPVTISILAEDGNLVYTKTFYVRPTASRMSLYLLASVFPDNYSVVVTYENGNLPYLVASRLGIERSG